MIPISSVEHHEEYLPIGFIHDLSLVTLASVPSPEAIRATGVRPITIRWNSRFLADNYRVHAYGMGSIREGEDDPFSYFLRLGRFYTPDPQECFQHYFPELDSRHSICFAGQWRQAVCVGDSGGPLVGFSLGSGGSRRSHLLGILTGDNGHASNRGCAPGTVAAAVNIDGYQEWIDERVGDDRRW